MKPSRRSFLSAAAGAALAPVAFPQSAPKLKITSVDAYPVKLWARTTQGKLPKFDGPDDIQRLRDAGVSEEGITNAIHICAHFCIINRVA